MNVFLPYRDYTESILCLDNKRLFKQLVECGQLINGLLNGSRWNNHPASKMYANNINSLIEYHNICYQICVQKGFKLVKSKPINSLPLLTSKAPIWLGYPPFHSRMRARLLFKDEVHYSQFKWSEEKVDDKVGYIWPVKKDLTLQEEIVEWTNERSFATLI